MSETLTDRRDRTKKELMDLIKDRNEVLAMYCTLAGVNADNGSADAVADFEHEQLQEFCESLIDYIARGQFELYQRIADGNERRQNIIDIANNIYPRISTTTDLAVEFNDLCDQSVKNADIIATKLPTLGEELAVRFELEDRLISALLSPKQTEATAS